MLAFSTRHPYASSKYLKPLGLLMLLRREISGTSIAMWGANASRFQVTSSARRRQNKRESNVMKRIISLSFALALAALPSSAYAVTIGADELLGIVEPGLPAIAANRMVMINGLLEGWTGVDGYNDGAASGTIMGDNPNDPQTEVYTLKYSATTVIPAPPAPLATTSSPTVVTGNLTFILTNTADWIAAKFGNDVAVFYIGNLAAGTEITLSLGGTGWDPQGHGLSGYTLFNEDETTVPDGGTTAMLLGCALIALGVLRHRMTA
jgi:hypothetical protein